MFHYLNLRKEEIKKYCKKAKIYSITVGKKPSKANFYVENPKKVQELINELVKASNRLSSSISTLDIRGLALNTKYRIKNIEEKEIEEDDNGEVRNSLKKKI